MIRNGDLAKKIKNDVHNLKIKKPPRSSDSSSTDDEPDVDNLHSDDDLDDQYDDQINLNKQYKRLSGIALNGNINASKKPRKSPSGSSINSLSSRPRLKPVLSVVSYSIGIQTQEIETFDKAVQTSNDTVSDLVGIYKDIDDLFNLIHNHTDNVGQEHLEILKSKVKKLTHMKYDKNNCFNNNNNNNK